MTNNGISDYFDVDVKSEFDSSEKTNQSEKTSDKEPSEKPVLYDERWIILIIFFLISVLNSIHLNFYTEIQNVMVNIYHPGDSNDKSSQYDMINWLSIVYIISHIVFCVPVMFLNDSLGFRCCSLLGISLSCIGSWIKYCSTRPEIYEILLFGQIVSGVSQTIISICVIQLSSIWFGRRELATSISVSLLIKKKKKFTLIF